MDLSEAAPARSECIVGETMEEKARDSKPAVAALVKREEQEIDSALGRVLGANGSCRASAMKNRSADTQLTIFYNGSVNVYDAVPPEKAQAIMFIAAAAAAAAAAASSANNMNVRRTPSMVSQNTSAAASPALMRSLSQQSSSTAASTQPAQLLTSPSSQLCKLQAELPGARRHSLQRFLEKRRDRLVSRAPYVSEKNFDGMEGSMDAKPQLL